MECLVSFQGIGHGGLITPQPIGCIYGALVTTEDYSPIHMVEIHTHARTEARTEFLQPAGQFA